MIILKSSFFHGILMKNYLLFFEIKRSLGLKLVFGLFYLFPARMAVCGV